jgi:hypothetical protein
LTLRTPELEAELQAGSFALEYVPGETNWLYIMDGQALVAAPNADKAITVSANQMLASGKGASALTPVALEVAAVRALHRNEPSQVAVETDPAFPAWLRDVIERQGIPSGLVLLILGLAAAAFVALRVRQALRK